MWQTNQSFKRQLHGTQLLQLLHSRPVTFVCIFKHMSSLEECTVTRGGSYWE